MSALFFFFLKKKKQGHFRRGLFGGAHAAIGRKNQLTDWSTRVSEFEHDLPVTLKRLQFPVLLAFAMTINKSQGQTFDRVGIYLPEPVFRALQIRPYPILIFIQIRGFFGGFGLRVGVRSGYG